MQKFVKIASIVTKIFKISATRVKSTAYMLIKQEGDEANSICHRYDRDPEDIEEIYTVWLQPWDHA